MLMTSLCCYRIDGDNGAAATVRAGLESVTTTGARNRIFCNNDMAGTARVVFIDKASDEVTSGPVPPGGTAYVFLTHRLLAEMEEIGAHDAMTAPGNDVPLADKLIEIDGDLIDAWVAETGATRSRCREALMNAGYRIYAEPELTATDRTTWPDGRGTGLAMLAVYVHDVIADTPPQFDLVGSSRRIVDELDLADYEAATVGDIVWKLGNDYASGEGAHIVAAWGWKLTHTRRLQRAIAETGDCVGAVADSLQKRIAHSGRTNMVL